MALIVEDGSIVANANSYVDLTFARAYATARGFDLPAVDVDLEALLLRAVDYLEAKRAKFQGTKTEPLTQTMQWPRYNVEIDCSNIDSDYIPVELKNAQSQLAVELNSGVDIQPTKEAGSFVIEDTVGPLTTIYSEKIGIGSQPSISSVDSLLAPLYSACGQRFALTSIRV